MILNSRLNGYTCMRGEWNTDHVMMVQSTATFHNTSSLIFRLSCHPNEKKNEGVPSVIFFIRAREEPGNEAILLICKFSSTRKGMAKDKSHGRTSKQLNSGSYAENSSI